MKKSKFEKVIIGKIRSFKFKKWRAVVYEPAFWGDATKSLAEPSAEEAVVPKCVSKNRTTFFEHLKFLFFQKKN